MNKYRKQQKLKNEMYSQIESKLLDKGLPHRLCPYNGFSIEHKIYRQMYNEFFPVNYLQTALIIALTERNQ